ncbi:hypothetical protein TNCV_1393821 [Trichonephila clavipes]|nr:hypothetical protein TNCV_1393821 [Trichonephila clavipes]
MADDNVVKETAVQCHWDYKAWKSKALRWTDRVESYFGILNETAWRRKIGKRELWRIIQRKAHGGCLARYDDECEVGLSEIFVPRTWFNIGTNIL